jgi:26S proteasome regulatory subunit N3
MPGKTPDKEPVENGGYRGGKDIEMKDKDLKSKGKKTGKKEGDDEMTVVVPPSKKQSSVPPPNDAEGDVAMDNADKTAEGEVKVDPVVQTINGMRNNIIRGVTGFVEANYLCFGGQTSRATLLS